jgi:predicted GTPase
VFLLANKIDLDYREVTSENGRSQASKLPVPYFEISAKTGQGIDDLFFKVIEHCT